MSERKVQITFTVSANEADVLAIMSDADKDALIETLAAVLRNKLQRGVLFQTGDQVDESNGKKLARLDEVLGNITPGMEE